MNIERLYKLEAKSDSLLTEILAQIDDNDLKNKIIQYGNYCVSLGSVEENLRNDGYY